MRKLLLFICVLTSFHINANSDSLNIKKAFSLLGESELCMTKYQANLKKIEKKCIPLIEEAYNYSKGHAYFLDELVTELLEFELYDMASKVLSRKKVDILTHHEKALHYSYSGMINYKNGFYSFKQSYCDFQLAIENEVQSELPNRKMLSTLYNSVGVMKLISDGPNSQPKGSPHSNWMVNEMIESFGKFRLSILLDDENTYAQRNHDTLKLKLREFFPQHKIDSLVSNIDFYQEDIASIQIINLRDSIKRMDSLRQLKFNLLPNNLEIIAKEFGSYDELLIISDISGSMQAIHPTKNVSRFDISNEIILSLLTKLHNKVKIGLTTVGGSCLGSPKVNVPCATNNRAVLHDEISSCAPGGTTPLNSVMKSSHALFEGINEDNKKALFLLSDGLESCGNTLDLCLTASNLSALGIDLYVLSFIVEGMSEFEYAYDVYNCITQYSEGLVYQIDINGDLVNHTKSNKEEEFGLLLPEITKGSHLKMDYFEVDLSDYFK